MTESTGIESINKLSINTFQDVVRTVSLIIAQVTTSQQLQIKLHLNETIETDSI